MGCAQLACCFALLLADLRQEKIENCSGREQSSQLGQRRDRANCLGLRVFQVMKANQAALARNKN